MTKIERLLKRYPIKIDMDFEGMEVRKDALVLGGCAGPQVDIQNLLHELGHFVEIDDARMLKWGWGLHYPMVELMGRTFPEPMTYQGVDRECRVIAYQAEISEWLGEEDPTEYCGQALEFLADYINIPAPCGKPSKEWVVNRISQHRKKYSLERFMSELERKGELLMENFPRTKENIGRFSLAAYIDDML